MTMADILDGAVEIVRLAPRTVFIVTGVLMLPIQIGVALASQVGLQSTTIGDVLGSPFLVGQVGSDRRNIALVLFVLGSALLPVLTGAIAWLVASWYGGSRPELADVARATAPRVPALLVGWLLVHLIEVVAAVASFFLLGLAAVPVMAFLLLTAPVIVVEGLGPIAAIRRSIRLARRHFLMLLGVALLSALVENVVFFAFVGLSGLVAGYSWGWMVAAVLAAVGTLASKPIVAGATALAYIDSRIRVEGLDLELAAAEHLGLRG
jgi:hypothetical protein